MHATIMSLLVKTFDRDRVLQRARELGAVKRVRALHPLDVLLSLVRCAVGDEHRSVATARRQFQDITGFMPEESSFYERLTPGLAELGWEMFLQVLARSNRVQRKEVARALGVHVRDVRAVDGCRVTLPARASAAFPSTDSRLGGFKITATLSLFEDLLTNVHLTDARQHDRKAFKLPDDVRSVLWLKDRGYSDHHLFAQIVDGGGHFIIRLKESSQPVVTAIRSGLAKAHRGKQLDRDLPFYGVVDLDARFNVGRRTRTFRVIGIPVANNKQGEPDRVWLATSLPEHVLAVTVGTFYRLRWTIGASCEGRMNQSVKVRPGPRDSRPCSWGGAVAREQDGEALRQQTSKGGCATLQVAAQANADVASLHANPVAETVDNARRQQVPHKTSQMRRHSPAGSQR